MESSLVAAAPEDVVDCGKFGKIPERSLWLLYLYASKLYRHMRQQDRDKAEENPDKLPELVAEILSRIAERRMRRSLNLGYRQRSAHLDRVRGRIKFLETERHQLLARGKIACEFEELTADTPRNRYVRAALLVIARKVESRRVKVGATEQGRFHHDDTASRCRKVATMMGQLGVKHHRPRDDEVFSVRSSHRDAEDDCMLAAARFAFELALPTRERSGRRLIAPPAPKDIRDLFEAAVTGFYRVVLRDTQWTVCSQPRFVWHPIGSEKSEYLPVMRPDIVLTRAGHCVVIDTKYQRALTSPSKTSRHKPRFHSKHLYQVYAYLRSQEDTSDDNRHATGILLYRQLDGEQSLSETSDIQGHKMRVYTLDMRASPGEIRARLIDIVKRESSPAYSSPSSST